MRRFFAALCLSAASALPAQSLGELAGVDAAQKPEQNKQAAAPQAAKKPNAAQENAAAGKASTQNEIAPEKFDDIFLKASNGDANAQLALGVFYARGIAPVSVDSAMALEWLGKSANQGNVAAMNYIGAIYGEGKLVKRDFEKAVYWRELAAEKGTAADKFALANAFIYGYMLPADANKALYWLEKAGDAGHVDAINQLISIYGNKGDKQNASKWKTRRSYAELKRAQDGDPAAMYEAYRKYIGGKGGFFKNVPKAVYWLVKSAEAGYAPAVDTLAMMHVRGRYVEKDFKKGVDMLAAIAKKDPSYAVKIANLYAEESPNKDLKKAAEWLDTAAPRLSGINKIHIIWRYWGGFGVEKDAKKASLYCAQMIEGEKGPIAEALKKLKADIEAGKAAPANFGDLYK